MRSDPAREVSDTIVVMAPVLITRGGVGWRLADLFPERHGFTVMVGSGCPLSRGHILLRSDNPTVHPRIFPEYFFRAVAATRSWRAAIPRLIALTIITGAWIISPAKSTPHSAGGPQQHRRLKRVALSQ
jgi:choline dehydrogenase-like flavoprotein